jgi:class 3 adenylate cyclase
VRRTTSAAAKRNVTVHVLFVDVVCYSTRDNPDQEQIVTALNQFVRKIKKELKPSATQEQLLFIPTGDGMAIAFLDEKRGGDNLVQPIKWAWAIRRCLKDWNKRHPETVFELRMGINTEAVKTVKDPYGRPNIAGQGINKAQRVMACGDANHVLASWEYREALYYHSKDYWPLLKGPRVRLPIKHGDTIDVCNLYGQLGGCEVPDVGKPTPKPKADVLPKDLQQSLLVMGEITTQVDYGKAALALSFSLAHQRRLIDISGVRPIRDGSEKDSHISKILDQYEIPDHTYMELTSIISPKEWATEFWRDNYAKRILRITSLPNTFTRRLHVIEEKDFAANLGEVIPLMTAEFICSVRARVLAIPGQQVVPISADPSSKSGHKWQDFVLFDCGTYHRSGGYYDVIVSDIEPYFRRDTYKESTFALYPFGGGDQGRYIYEELRANFFRGWHNRQTERVLTLPQILERGIQSSVNLYDVGKIKQYLPRNVSLPADLETRLKAIIEQIMNSRLPDRKAEDRFIERLPTLRALNAAGGN